NNALGIILGLIAGKFAGIMLAVWLALKAGIANKSEGMSWRLMSGVSILAGIGFTMSIFITNLAFSDTAIIISSKLAILLASLIAAVLGLMILFSAKKTTSM
ncbi:MAG: Na+/H+ antiporter NhaA, partial [Flavisolibacter sp.]